MTMAKKHNGTDSSALLQFDSRTNTVSAQVHTMDNMKEKISKVREITPSSKKDDIIQVLHHFDGDVEKSIDAYRQNGAQEILSQWNVPNRRGKAGGNNSKKNKKKKHKGGPNGSEDEQPAVPHNNNNIEKPTSLRIESVENSNVPSNNNNNMPKDSTVPPPQPRRETNRSRRENPNPRQAKTTGPSRTPRLEPRQDSNPRPNNRGRADRVSDITEGRGVRDPEYQKTIIDQSKTGKQKGQASSRPSQQSGRRRNLSEGSDKGGRGDRERTTSEKSTSQDNKPKKPSSVLERGSKDLQRTLVSLTRHTHLLGEEFDRSEKRLKKAFGDARQSLEQREIEMLRQLKELKRQSSALLETRHVKALELKMATNRAATMSEEQLNELRAEIKHFVSERKVDEEIGKTMRFTWNPDPLNQAIKTTGEVIPIKTMYSARRPSVTSDTSGTFSRTTSVSEDPSGPLSGSTSRVDSSVPPTPTTPEIDVQAEVSYFAAKLQRSLNSRGGPRRPRNDASRSQGRQSGNDNRPQEEQAQKNHDSHNQQEPPNREDAAKPNRNQQGPRNREDAAKPNRNQQGPRNRGGEQGSRPNRKKQDPKNRGKEGAQNRSEPNRERLSSSSSTGKGDESPDGSPKKSHNAIRREQYRRRHNFENNGADVTTEDKDRSEAPSAETDSNNANSKIAVVEPTDSKHQSSTGKVAEDSSMNSPSTEQVAEDKDGHKNDVGKSNLHINSELKELNIVQNGSEVEENDLDTVDTHVEEDGQTMRVLKGIPNGDIHGSDHLRYDVVNGNSSDKPIVNGEALVPTLACEEGLPQRQPRQRKEREITEVVKEVSVMNGVVGTEEDIVEH